MRLHLRVIHCVPECFGIPVFFAETGAIRLHFKGLPIQGNGTRIKQVAKKRFIASVPLCSAQLVEVKNVGTKHKIVCHLFNGDFSTHCGSGNSDCSIGLSIRSEENTSELQSLKRSASAVLCLKKQT